MDVMSGLNFTVLVPQLIVVVTGMLLLLVDAFSSRQKSLPWISLAGVLLASVVSYTLRDQSNLTFQDMAAADGYALFFHLLFCVAATLAILISVDYLGRQNLIRGEYYALLLFATAGMMVMSSATDLITVFLGLEIMSISLYVLAGFQRGELRSGEAALKYFLLGAFASGFLLYGIALVYGATGTTNLARIVIFLTAASRNMLLIGVGLLIVGFGFKVALVPFQFWTPDVYQGAPTSVTAFMSVGAKAAGFAAFARVFLYAFPALRSDWVWPLAVLSVLTMTLGNVVAIAQTNLKRMLAYSSIAHAGYILVGLTAGSEDGAAATMFYLLAYAFMNIGAFAVVIAGGKLGKTGEELAEFRGLAQRKPWLAAAMAVFMLSLAGVPPLAGFLGKLYLFSAAVQGGLTWLAVIGVINSVLSAYFYLRVVVYMYMYAPARELGGEVRTCPALSVALGVAAVGLVLLGLIPSPVLAWVRWSAQALLG